MLPSLFVELTGSVAACLSTLCWVPQALRAFRTRDTRSISLAMQLMLVAAIILWMIYGTFLMSWPLIISNGVSLLFVGIILGLKLRYG